MAAEFNPYDSWTVQAPWSYGEDVTLDEVLARVEADPEAGALSSAFLDADVNGPGLVVDSEIVDEETVNVQEVAPVDAVEEPAVDAPADVPADVPADAPVDAPADAVD